MTEPTVTMTISEYRLIEAKIKAFERILNGEKGPMVIDDFHCYYGEFIVVNDEANSVLLKRLEETIKARDAAYEKIRRLEGRLNENGFKRTWPWS